MGIPIQPSRNLTATGAIAIKNVGHAQERQRVAIARATVGKPQIVLAGEPTATLDHRNSDQVAAIFRELSQADNLAVLIVTHDARLRSIADTVITMEDGRIVSEQSN